MNPRLHSFVHTTRRVVQSPAAFTNWPRLLADMTLERFSAGPQTLRFVTRGGLQIECPNRRGARVPIYEIFAEDCYHFDWFLDDLARRPIRVVDIGAHVGTFACRLAQIHPDATIHAYEPSPTTADFLRGNIEANDYTARITAHQAAVAATAGTVFLDDNGGGSGLNGLVSTGRGSESTGTAVDAISFDDVMAAVGGDVDLIKIDCEGGEYDLIFGSTPSTWDSVQRVVIEYHEVAGRDWPELREWFASRGLTVQRHEPTNHEGLGVAWLSRSPLSPVTT